MTGNFRKNHIIICLVQPNENIGCLPSVFAFKGKKKKSPKKLFLILFSKSSLFQLGRTQMGGQCTCKIGGEFCWEMFLLHKQMILRAWGRLEILQLFGEVSGYLSVVYHVLHLICIISHIPWVLAHDCSRRTVSNLLSWSKNVCFVGRTSLQRKRMKLILLSMRVVVDR